MGKRERQISENRSKNSGQPAGPGAAAAADGYGRSIKPVGTLADGDTIYGVSAGERVTADLNMALVLI